jgi:hypothetical protein
MIPNQAKYIGSSALYTLPAIMLYLTGFPSSTLVYNTILIQCFASLISFSTLRLGNYLRSLELISSNKNFNTFSYVNKLLYTTSIDIILTCVFNFNYIGNMYKYDLYQINKITICAELDAFNRIVMNDNKYPMSTQTEPLVYFRDKLSWLAGRIVVDSIFIALSYAGKIEDLRTPFFKVMERAQKVIKSVVTSPKAIVPAKIKLSDRIATPEETDHVTYPSTSSSSSSTSKNRAVVEPKIRINTSLTKPAEQTEQDGDRKGDRKEDHKENRKDIPQQIEVNNLTFYRLDLPKLPENTWGVICPKIDKKKNDLSRHKTSLENPTMANERSNMKYLNAKTIEVRPKGSGFRLIGKIHQGRSALDRILPLGQSMDTYDKFCDQSGISGEPNLIAFDQFEKHEDVNKALAR